MKGGGKGEVKRELTRSMKRRVYGGGNCMGEGGEEGGNVWLLEEYLTH